MHQSDGNNCMSIYLPKSKNTEVLAHHSCYGIDLGTTYTLMAQVETKHVDFSKSNRIPVQFVRFKQTSPNTYDSAIEDEKVASIVALIDGKPYIGNNLYHLKGSDGMELHKNIFYHWKVEMGVDHHPMNPDAVTEKLDMPYKVAGLILKFLRATHLQDADKQLDNAIITVPASFQVNQRQDTIRAAEIGGITTSQQMLIDEPNAAFLGYFNRLPEDQKLDWAKSVRNKDILVIDFGGGTLDLSILNVNFSSEHGIMLSNKAISRYSDLGGQDLDNLIAEEFLLPKMEKMFKFVKEVAQRQLNGHILPQLSVIAEQLKKGICEKLSLNALDNDVRTLALVDYEFSLVDCQVKFENEIYDLGEITINGKDFDDFFRKIFQGKSYAFRYVDKRVTTISESISQIIDKTSSYMNDIDFVLYVGGSSFNPLLQSYVSEKLKHSHALSTHEPDKLVAEGAAVYSYFYHMHGVALIAPITSEAIGIRTKGNAFKEIIGDGTQLPVKVQIPDFKLQSNMQEEIVIPVCINSIDFPIGEMRCSIDGFYEVDTEVTIDASLTADKVFELSVLIDGNNVGTAVFDNPYSVGMINDEQRELMQLKSKINQAKQKKNKQEEKKLLRELIWKHSDAKNHLGAIECAEEYIRKFDDQDDGVWNLLFCRNHSLGRLAAAKKALSKAIELDSEQSTYIYNYSLILEKDSPLSALQFLNDQSASIQADASVSIKRVLLSEEAGEEWKEVANQIVTRYKMSPSSFSNFDKRVLLPELFKLVDEPFSYVEPKKSDNKLDEGNYLTAKNQLRE